MAEGPVSILSPNTLRVFAKYPKSRLIFVTIKDNGQNGRWTKIGKVNDWIRRYSDLYIIVRGMTGGIHFHLLAGLKPNRHPRPAKGIHFHMKFVDQKEKVPFDPLEYKEAYERAWYVRHETFMQHPVVELMSCEARQITFQICEGIRTYWSLRAQRAVNNYKAREARSQKQQSILRLLVYCSENLAEPRSQPIREYVDYITKGLSLL